MILLITIANSLLVLNKPYRLSRKVRYLLIKYAIYFPNPISNLFDLHILLWLNLYMSIEYTTHNFERKRIFWCSV